MGIGGGVSSSVCGTARADEVIERGGQLFELGLIDSPRRGRLRVLCHEHRLYDGAQLYERWRMALQFGNQVLISSHRMLLSSKATVVNVAETSGQDPGRHGREGRAQANRCGSVETRLGDVRTGG